MQKNTFISHNTGEKKCVLQNNTEFSCFNWRICRDGQALLYVYAPYWFEGQGVTLRAIRVYTFLS